MVVYDRIIPAQAGWFVWIFNRENNRVIEYDPIVVWGFNSEDAIYPCTNLGFIDHKVEPEWGYKRPDGHLQTVEGLEFETEGELLIYLKKGLEEVA